MRTLILALILLTSCVAQPYRTGEVGPWNPPDDMNPEEFIDYLIAEGSSWVVAQRETLRPTANELPDDLRDQYSAYFQAGTLDAIRYRLVDEIENPGFYNDQQLGSE